VSANAKPKGAYSQAQNEDGQADIEAGMSVEEDFDGRAIGLLAIER
jgi:hypothetical protein